MYNTKTRRILIILITLLVFETVCMCYAWANVKPEVAPAENVELDIPIRAVKTFEEVIAEAEEPEPEPMIVEEVIDYGMSQEDIELIALVTMGEAEGEPEEGKRLVIDTILNRIDSERFKGNNAHDVIYAKNQFSCMWDGRIERCYVKEEIVELVKEELLNRANSEVLYFRADYYHNFGTPVMQVGNHYFSTT